MHPVRMSCAAGLVAISFVGGGCGGGGPSSGRTELVPDEPRSAWGREEPLWYRQPELLVPPGSGVSPNQGAKLREEQERLTRDRKRLDNERAAYESQKRAADPALHSRPVNPDRVKTGPQAATSRPS